MDDVTAQGRKFLEELDHRIAGGPTATTRAGLFRAMKVWVLAVEALLDEHRKDHADHNRQKSTPLGGGGE